MEKEIFELMTKMYSEMTEMKSEIKEINNKVDNLENKVDKGFKETNDRIDGLLDGIRETIVNEASEEISKQLFDIKADIKTLDEKVDFLAHKEQKTEMDIFSIKRKLEVIK